MPDGQRLINELTFQLQSKEVVELHYPIQLSVKDANAILELLKEQEYARCLNCQFRDFGENEVDSWDRCKLHRHNTSPDEYCSWFVERAGEVG